MKLIEQFSNESQNSITKFIPEIVTKSSNSSKIYSKSVEFSICIEIANFFFCLRQKWELKTLGKIKSMSCNKKISSNESSAKNGIFAGRRRNSPPANFQRDSTERFKSGKKIRFSSPDFTFIVTESESTDTIYIYIL